MKDRICLWHICQLLRFTLRMVAMASKPTARAPGGIVASVRQQMKLSAKLTVNGEDRPIDVADKTVAENDVRDFPVPPLPDTGNPQRAVTRAVAHPGWLRNASFASSVNSALFLPSVISSASGRGVWR